MTSFNSCDSGVAQQVDGSTLDVTKGPLSREFGFIPNKEPCILKLYKGQEIKFCNASQASTDWQQVGSDRNIVAKFPNLSGTWLIYNNE